MRMPHAGRSRAGDRRHRRGRVRCPAGSRCCAPRRRARPARRRSPRDDAVRGRRAGRRRGAGGEGEENENEEAAEQAEGIARKREALERRASMPARPVGQQRPAGDAPAPGLGRRAAVRGDGARRLGAGRRRGSPRRLGLHPRDPLRRVEAVQRQLPDALHRAAGQQRRRRDVRRQQAAVRLQGQRASSTRSSRSSRPTGTVYAVYMNGFNVLFTKSTDHGATWSTPRPGVRQGVRGTTSRSSPRATTARTSTSAFNGPTGGDPWIAQSHDSGAAWTQAKLVDSNRYFFAFDGDVAAGRHRLLRRRPACSTAAAATRAPIPTGAIEEHVFVSTQPRPVLDGQARGHRPAGPGLRRGGLHAGLLPRPQRARRRRRRVGRAALRRRRDDPAASRRSRPGGRPIAADLVGAGDAVGDRRAGARPRPSSRRAAATSGRGTSRRPAVGTRPVEHLVPPLDRRRRHVVGAGRRSRTRPVAPRTRRPPGTSSRTATTARWPSRRPARRSRSGARARATTARAASGTTASPDRARAGDPGPGTPSRR